MPSVAEMPVVDRHEKSRSPPRAVEYRSTESQRARHRDELEQQAKALNADLGRLKKKIVQLEDVIEDKDAQIAAMIQTLDEKEKEIERLHATPPAPSTAHIEELESLRHIKEGHERLIKDL